MRVHVVELNLYGKVLEFLQEARVFRVDRDPLDIKRIADRAGILHHLLVRDRREDGGTEVVAN